MKNKKIIVYTFRGPVERGSDYHWVNGYSETSEEGGIYYPWMTKRECQADAKKQGATAKFVGPNEAAHAKRL